MASQSSGVVAFRAFVMLAFVIAIPVVALLGTDLPNTLRQLAERHLGISFNSGSPSATACEAPLNAALPTGQNGAPAGLPSESSLVPPQVSLPAANTAPPAAMSAMPAMLPAPPPAVSQPSAPLALAANIPTPPPMPAPLAAAGPDAGVVPVGYNAPADPFSASAATRAGAVPSSMPSPNPAPSSPPAFEPPNGQLVPGDRAALPAAIPPAPRAAESNASGDSLSRIQQRLRELGATYSLLESWGTQGQLYRFYCKMAIGGNANYTRYFEATDSDPVRAMNTVLQQAEAWRAGRL